MSITMTKNPIADYCTRIANASPAEALQIALAEAERERAVASAAQAEYRALAEVNFDEHGRIVKANLGGLWRLAQMYAGSMIVPAHYQQKPNDCFIACQIAYRLRVDPFAYMQASYVVHGKPGLEAKLAVAMLNTSDKITGRVRYRDERDNKGVMTACTAYAFDKETGEEVTARVTWQMALDEGWVNKSGSKWKTLPELMFHYRSATFLIRQYYPEVLMGMRTLDELEDSTDPAPSALTPARNLNDLAARLEGPLNGNGNGHAEGTVETADVPAPADIADRPDTTPEPDPAFATNLKARLAECDTPALVDQVRADFMEKAGNASEESIVDFETTAAKEALGRQSAKGKQKELVK